MFFTYLLGWSTLHKFYYGVRYKEGISIDSVGTTYFSSSKYVKNFIETHGIPDIVEIRKTFLSALEAKEWETRVLRKMRAAQSDNWLNKTNNSFKNTIMNETIRKQISLAKKGKKLGKYYTNGIKNILLREDQPIPVDFIVGRTLSQKQEEHVRKLNMIHNTPESRKRAAIKCADKTRGRKKPEGHGAKVSAALSGKEKPWAKGKNNVSYRPEVREKISLKKRGRLRYTNGNRVIYVLCGEEPEGFFRG